MPNLIEGELNQVCYGDNQRDQVIPTSIKLTSFIHFLYKAMTFMLVYKAANIYQSQNVEKKIFYDDKGREVTYNSK